MFFLEPLKPCPPEEDHANYAFPSKILEYMTSGTAVASTMVGGIPDEYFEYIYPVSGHDAGAISEAITDIFRKNYDLIFEKGEKAKEFALAEKDYLRQGTRVVEFLKKVLS